MKVGIIVGRFQVPELTEGHKHLIELVTEENDEVVIFIGVAGVRNTKNEPLPYHCREQMIRKYAYNKQMSRLLHPDQAIKFPSTYPIYDIGHLKQWCINLDLAIENHCGKNRIDVPEVTIYGGRHSVAGVYNGKFQVKEIESIENVSASIEREKIYQNLESFNYSRDFRAGLVYASQWRYPTGVIAADCACIKDNCVLLGRKPNRTQFQLIGGHFDPMVDNSLEETALRELKEETGIIACNPQYVGSFVQKHDHRYLKETDKMITTLYKADWVAGEAVANDDIEQITWASMDSLFRYAGVEKMIVPDHVPLIMKLINK